MMMKEKSILIVDDHSVIRRGLRGLLEENFNDVKINEADNEEALLDIFKSQRVDVLVMDIQIPKTDCISVVEYISIKYPKTYILMFSMLPEHIYGKRLLKAGAKGFLPKESSFQEIVAAFKIVFDSKKYITSCLVSSLKADQFSVSDSDPFSCLSYREFEIMNHLLSGMNINTISEILNLKPSTIGTYKARVFDKLSVQNVFELNDLAMLHKLQRHAY